MTPTVPRPAPTHPTLSVVVVGASALMLILGPVLALGVRVPWERLGEVLASADTRAMLRVTIFAGLWATALATALGVPLALWIRHLRRGGKIIRLLVLLPLAMPPVVAGLALTAAVGRRSLASPLFDALGIQLAFAFPGVVLAHVFITLPFVVVTVDAALQQIDPEIPTSAAGIGMRPGEIQRRILLPAVASALATGTGLAFARSLGEFGTTLTFAGSMPGVTRTMPLGIYLERELDPGRAYLLGVVLIGLALVVLALSALPLLLRRPHVPRACTVGPLDTERLRELSTPPGGGVPVTVTVDGVTTHFPADRTTAVVGPNGSGKSTLMGLIAGRLTGATVDVPGRVILLTQRPGLPGTTTVAGAVTMATRSPGITRELLDAAGLATLHDVPVTALSGGQAAQVALVRALGARPEVLILDEPLAAVDVESAAEWRTLLRAATRDRTTLLVTHDALDVAGLSEHLVVLTAGRVTASGATADLLAVPPDDFVSTLAGLNRIEGIATETEIDTVTMYHEQLMVTGTIPADSGDAVSAGTAVVVTFPPEATTLRIHQPDWVQRNSQESVSARNVWPGTVDSVESPVGRTSTVVTVSLHTGGEPVRISVPVTRRSVRELGLVPGTTVDCVTKATAVTAHVLHRTRGGFSHHAGQPSAPPRRGALP